MKTDKVRTAIDIPAAAQGCSARELILRRVEFPLIKSKGPKVSLSNEQVYEHVEFP